MVENSVYQVIENLQYEKYIAIRTECWNSLKPRNISWKLKKKHFRLSLDQFR